ncbi:DNA polymerase I [Taklimakanibacter lacteus]|uniref:DNA polymerase I n=1 Tax=Taklimakanibacter lacteus TaxID=2268456 RepID=UPI0034D3C939
MSQHRPLKSGDHVYLIDGSGYIFRAYHALPPLTRKSDGLPVGAVQGFCNMLWKLLKDMKAGEKPTHLAVIFDKSEQTFRKRIYADYKAHRPDPPADLIPQFGLIRQATRAFNVACIEQDDYEADDLIATYARQAAEKGATVRIVSSDKDLMQLVTDKVKLYDTMKDKEIGAAEVLEKFGVAPGKVVDVQALAGDSVDNVPGVPGIGVKTGAQLITEFGSLEALLERAAEIKQQKRRENLIQFADQARISKQLVTLVQDMKVDHPLDTFMVDEPRASELIGFCKTMEFASLMRRVAADLSADAAEIEAVPVTIKGWPPEGAAIGTPAPAARPAYVEKRKADPQHEATRTVFAAVEEKPKISVAEKLAAIPFTPAGYQTVIDKDGLERWVSRIIEEGQVAIDIAPTAYDPMQAELAGIALSVAPGEACYVPVGHRAGDGLDFGGSDIRQLPIADLITLLKPVLEDPSILKIGQNLKVAALIFRRLGIALRSIEDTMLMSYALESGLNGHGRDELAQKHLGHKPIAYKEVAGTGKSAVSFDKVPLDRATHYAAESADITIRLWLLFHERLAREHKTTVYQTLERPLVPVLAAMEREGILVDRAVLARLSGEFATSGARIEKQVYELAGETFNIGSPKQLGDILFGRMGLTGGRKTQTGAWSTDSDVLEDLAGQGIDLARQVLDWRQLSKLRSTYTDALPAFINPDTGRVHTSYALAATSTGRLSSNDPNLQNIPVRTEEGRRIRTAFIAPKGAKLISADYSQIELRVLAHVADIPQLRKAFADGLDIHAMTASEMFGVPVKGMDPAVRRRAKAINFGIIYGISAFGLANQLGIPREEAANYIKTYFQRFPGIKDYMDSTRKEAREKGYVETIFGRRCHFPRITSPNASERSFMERAAINAPIQGAAADIIRRAMIRMPDALAKAGLGARMLLQVHDELIFEALDAEVEALKTLVKDVMEKAPEPAVKLAVPLAVDARAAHNWEEAH